MGKQLVKYTEDLCIIFFTIFSYPQNIAKKLSIIFSKGISVIQHPRSNCYNNFMSQNNTGTYIYDKKLGKVVKVSDRVPSRQKSATAAHHVCNGCCGHCACHDD